MLKSVRVPYLETISPPKPTDFMPIVPLIVKRGENSVGAFGLLDSGATVNVLPYRIGLELGVKWEQLTTRLELSGNLANYDARGLLLTVKIADLEERDLIFAWTKAENVPLLLGQTNFFMEFDVCFFRSQNEFEIKTR